MISLGNRNNRTPTWPGSKWIKALHFYETQNTMVDRKPLLRDKLLTRSHKAHFTVRYYLIFLSITWMDTKPLLTNCRWNNDMDMTNNEEDASQIQWLESWIIKMQMSVESIRKDNSRTEKLDHTYRVGNSILRVRTSEKNFGSGGAWWIITQEWIFISPCSTPGKVTAEISCINCVILN